MLGWRKNIMADKATEIKWEHVVDIQYAVVVFANFDDCKILIGVNDCGRVNGKFQFDDIQRNQ